jgi:hypothetical protein
MILCNHKRNRILESHRAEHKLASRMNLDSNSRNCRNSEIGLSFLLSLGWHRNIQLKDKYVKEK